MDMKRALKNIAILSALLLTVGCIRNAEPVVRQPVLAGQWYPAGVGELAFAVDSFLARATDVPAVKDLRILVLPHAGYAYSGQVAAYGYALAKSLNPGVIVLLAPPHRSPVRGIALSSSDFFETPLGRVKIDKETVKELSKTSGFAVNDEAHRLEHSIEIHLPFLQRIYGKKMEGAVPVLPLLVGELGGTEEECARMLALKIRGKNPLVIVSSDFTHYGPRFEFVPVFGKSVKELKEGLKNLDMGAINAILKFDRRGFSRYVGMTGITVCGRNPISLALALPMNLSDARLLQYDTSCAITGECDHSVSYAAIALGGSFADAPPKQSFSESDKKFLLGLARKNIQSSLVAGRKISVEHNNIPEACRIRRGVFVTLKKDGELRGCIGTVIPEAELYELVIDNSYNAAFRDPRFPPLSREEFGRISIEISILTEPEEVRSIDEIVVGRDGLIVVMDGRSGLLLPQVPVEQGWNRDEFLMWVCRKAHLPDDAWRRGARLYRFQAVVFGEHS